MVDLKHHCNEKHIQGTGIGYEDILENLQLLMRRNTEVIVRIPVIPGYNDSQEDAEKFAQLLRKIGVTHVELLPFHQFGERKYELLGMPYSMKGVSQLNSDDLAEFSKIIEDKNIQTQMGG
jgi:pyruvate formate lyase activating enzyme